MEVASRILPTLLAFLQLLAHIHSCLLQSPVLDPSPIYLDAAGDVSQDTIERRRVVMRLHDDTLHALE